MRIGVILDGTRITRWQAEALETLAGEAEFIVYSCTNTVSGKRQLRHGLYYLLNLFTIRNRLTRSIEFPSILSVAARRRFEAINEGSWQSLPAHLLTSIAQDRPAVIVKFGMGLLRIPPPEQLSVPILSYHHGDPGRFRGRPAGFYELLQGVPTVGQIVQVLSNKLDAGKVVARAETKALDYSYRMTLIEAYRQSPLLLRTAIRNVIGGNTWEPHKWGRAYRLPTNGTVLRFVIQRVRAAVSRLLYGLFWEKRWTVVTASQPRRLTLESVTSSLAEASHWRSVETPRGYRFLGDPFFHPHEGLLVEGMHAASARGDILHVREGHVKRLSQSAGHLSYPALIDLGSSQYVVPEMSEWSIASAFPLVGESLGERIELRIPGQLRLLDPTPFWHGDVLYLFGNMASEGQSVLRLWFGDTIEGEFSEHPASPICISPNGARMAGIPILMEDRLVRIGQDFRRAYGNGISFFEITELDRSHYFEEPIGEFRFAGRKGPHTLNFGRDEMTFDYYLDAFSLLAGIRRFKERRAARRIGD